LLKTARQDVEKAVAENKQKSEKKKMEASGA
jgi:hypothetical protein